MIVTVADKMKKLLYIRDMLNSLLYYLFSKSQIPLTKKKVLYFISFPLHNCFHYLRLKE